MDTIVFKLIFSLLLGAFIGGERQIHQNNENKGKTKTALGLRTFALVTTIGTISGLLETKLPSFFILISLGIILLIVGYYVFDSIGRKDSGITTEVALLFSFVIGVLIAVDILSIQLIIGLTVVLVFILSQKERLGSYIKAIKVTEMQSLIRYAIIALVILPLLPNVAYTIQDIPYALSFVQSLNLPFQGLQKIELVNPFQLWLFVALVTGIDVAGYILEKVIGKSKGWLLTSFAGGFVSSTATTQSLAQQSKKSQFINLFIVAAIITNLASFLQHALLIFPLNFDLFIKVIPVIFLMILASGILIYFFKRSKKLSSIDIKSDSKNEDLFHFYPAIKFAILFVIIKFLSSLALLLFGSSGFFLTIALGAIPGLDAVLITIAQNAGHTISFQSALIAFIIANAVNLSVKSLLSFLQGGREFALKFTISAFVILLIGLFGVFLQL